LFYHVSCLGGTLLLPKWWSTTTSYRGPRGRFPGGVGILPDQRRDHTPVQGEGRIPDGEEEESTAHQVVAEEGVAFLRRTPELKSSQGYVTNKTNVFRLTSFNYGVLASFRNVRTFVPI